VIIYKTLYGFGFVWSYEVNRSRAKRFKGCQIVTRNIYL